MSSRALGSNIQERVTGSLQGAGYQTLVLKKPRK